MAAKKSSQPQPNEIASVPTKPTIIALKSKKSPQAAPESLQQDVEPPASVEPLTPVEPPAVEPPALESKPTKLPPPIKRTKAKVPVPDITQELEATPTHTELEATPTPAEPSLEGDSESVPNNALFQAIGVIVGEVSFDENEQGSISIEQKLYPLFYAPRHKKSYEGLKKEIERTGNHKQRLLVYPRVTHFPKREQNHRIGFQLVAFEGAGKDLKQDIGLSDFEFKLCGLWQFIPVCSIPCFSVFKNLTTERIAHIKESSVEHRGMALR